MKISIFSIFSAALFVAGVSAQLTVNTPVNVIVCEPLQITFSGGTPPYTLLILPGSTPDGTPMATFTNVTSSPFTLSAVNYPAGTSLGLTLRDSTGLSAQSAAFTVISGGPTSCLNGTVASGSSGPAASTGASSPTNGAATATGTTPASSGSNSGNSGSGSSTSKAASPSSSGNAAIVAAIPYSVAGVLGAVIAAVFV